VHDAGRTISSLHFFVLCGLKYCLISTYKLLLMYIGKG